MDLQYLPITYQGSVLGAEIDEMDHMNVAYYLHKFNLATLKFLDSFGFGKQYRANGEFGGFVLEHHIKYLAEVRLNDSLTIFTRALAHNHKLIHSIHFMVRDKDNKLSATCECLNIHIDRKQRKSAPFPPEILNNYQLIEKAHQQLSWQAPISGIIGIQQPKSKNN